MSNYKDKYKNENSGDDYYIIPEKGSDAQPTGKQLIYRRGEFGEKWRLMKASAETQKEKKHYAEYELRDIKKDQVIYNKDVGAFTDGRGKKYYGNDVNKQNNLVRARMNLVIKEMGIEDKNYINKWMFSKDRDLNTEVEEIEPEENDWAHESLKTPEEVIEGKKLKLKKVIATPVVTKSYEPLTPIYLPNEFKEFETKVEEPKQESPFDGKGIAHEGILALNKALYGKIGKI